MKRRIIKQRAEVGPLFDRARTDALAALRDAPAPKIVNGLPRHECADCGSTDAPFGLGLGPEHRHYCHEHFAARGGFEVQR